MAVAPWYILLHCIDPTTGEPKSVALDASGNLPISGTVSTAPALTLTAIPAVNEPAPAMRFVPTGPIGQAQCVGVVMATEYTGTTDPAPGAPGITTRPMQEPWNQYETNMSGAGEVKALVKNTRGNITAVYAWNNTSSDLYVMMHDATDAGAISTATARLGRPLPKKGTTSLGYLFHDMTIAAEAFSSGIVVSVSTSPIAYAAPAFATGVYFGVRWK